MEFVSWQQHARIPGCRLHSHSSHSPQRKIAAGSVAKIDPRFYNRSFAEGKLIQVIKRCYVHNPDERADINELQRMLEAAIAEDELRKEMNIQDPVQAENVAMPEEDHSDFDNTGHSEYDDTGHSEHDDAADEEEGWYSGDSHSDSEATEEEPFSQDSDHGDSAFEDE